MISVVVPLFNEELLVNELIDRLFSTLTQVGQPFEIVCVEDGSSDNTLLILSTLKKDHQELKIIVLSRNFGHQASLSAGIQYAKGEYVVLIDGDLQDPPELIKDLYKSISSSNLDVVIAKRSSRNEKAHKKWAIKWFHKLFDSISGIQEMEDSGHFCILRRNVANALIQIKEKTRYLPGLRSFVGFKQSFVEYDRPDRPNGKSKMSTRKLFSLASDAIFSFSKWPIKMCLWLGLIGIVIIVLAGIYSIVSKFFDWAPFGWSSTILSIYFIGTIQLTFLGVIGEYLYRIYKEVQNRPLYFVREIIE